MKIKTKKRKEKGVEPIPQNTKLLSLILTIPFSQSIHNQIKEVIRKLELKDQDQKRP